MTLNEISLGMEAVSFIASTGFAIRAVFIGLSGRYAEAAYWMAFAAWVWP